MNGSGSVDRFIPSYDVLLDRAMIELGLGEERLFGDIALNDAMKLCELKWCIWAASKNEARVRLIRDTIDAVGGMLIFTETRKVHHACADEIRGLTGVWDNDCLVVVDTSHVAADRLGWYYHHGRLHVNATDPQSVSTGIPYRLFQCAASGRALLTDYRMGWAGVFTPDVEVLSYESAGNDYKERLVNLIGDRGRLEQVCRNARLRFELEHTWEHRFDQLMSQVNGGRFFGKTDKKEEVCDVKDVKEECAD